MRHSNCALLAKCKPAQAVDNCVITLHLTTTRLTRPANWLSPLLLALVSAQSQQNCPCRAQCPFSPNDLSHYLNQFYSRSHFWSFSLSHKCAKDECTCFYFPTKRAHSYKLYLWPSRLIFMDLSVRVTGQTVSYRAVLVVQFKLD